MFITGEVGELYMNKLEIKGKDNTKAILSMDDSQGLLQSLTLDDVVFDGENQARKAIFPDAGLIYGKLDIQNCEFKGIDASIIIDTVTEAKLYSVNPGYLETVVFKKNTIGTSAGHIAFRG